MNLKSPITLNKKIPAILAVVILLVGVVVGLALVAQQQGFSLKAGPTSTPRQVRVTNITDTSFTVSWTTDTNVSGYVKYGQDGKTDQTLSDSRDQISGSTGQYTTHYVVIRNLTANTNYTFLVGSGSQTYDNNGSPYTQKTGPRITTKTEADTINGQVNLASGQPAPGIIVYLEMSGASPLSAITKNNGTWNLSLSTLRTQDLTGYQTYDPATSQYTILAQGGDLGTATATVTTTNDTPVPDIILGQNHDFTTGTAASSLSGDQATQADTTNSFSVANTGLTPATITVDPGANVTFFNQDTVAHTFTSDTNAFSTGPIPSSGNATVTAPLTPGDYPFTDATDPQATVFKGVIIVQSGSSASQESASITPSPTPSTANDFSDLTSNSEATLSVQLLNPGFNGESIATSSPELLLEGPVGQKVTITVRSTPQTDTLTFGSDGTLAWTPPADLEPGEHTVTIEYTDDAGILQTIVRSFTVLAAEPDTDANLPSFTASPSATLSPTPTATPSATPSSSMPSTASGVPEAGFLTPTLALFTLGIGLFLSGLIKQIKVKKP